MFGVCMLEGKQTSFVSRSLTKRQVILAKKKKPRADSLAPTTRFGKPRLFLCTVPQIPVPLSPKYLSSSILLYQLSQRDGSPGSDKAPSTSQQLRFTNLAYNVIGVSFVVFACIDSET